MRAVVQTAYGSTDGLKLTELAKPVPRDDEVLIRVHAASVHADVWHVVSGLPYILRLMGSGVRKPLQPIPGTDVSGIIEAVGPSISRFKPGDEVFGETLRGSIQWVNGGAFADYVTCPATALALKPAHISFETAASVPTSGLIALDNLRHAGRLKAGQQVLINGAGGAVGSLALQIAKALGATVTAVDSADKQGLLRDLGADQVLYFAKFDFTKGSERYDLIFDIPGNHPLAACKRALKRSGVYVLIGHDNYGQGMHRVLGLIPRMMGIMLRALFDKQLPAGISLPNRTEGMEVLRGLLENGKLTPHIDRSFPLSEVPQALAYLKLGRAKGKIIIRL